MCLTHVWVNSIRSELPPTDITPMTSTRTRYVITAINFLGYNFAARAPLDVTHLCALVCTRLVPATAIGAPLLLTFLALVHERPRIT